MSAMKRVLERFQTVTVGALIHKKWLVTEMRVKVNLAKVTQYAQEKKKGARFPPPVVFCDETGVYRVGDGFHRILADKENKKPMIEIDIRPGGLKEAILHNLKANREANGLPFQRGDISKSIKTLLTLPEFEGWSRMRIHQEVGCNYSLVSKIALQIGLPRHKSGMRPVVDREKVKEMIAGGKTYKQVAEELKVSKTCLYNSGVRDLFEDCPHCRGTGRVLKPESK